MNKNGLRTNDQLIIATNFEKGFTNVRDMEKLEFYFSLCTKNKNTLSKKFLFNIIISTSYHILSLLIEEGLFSS